MLLILQNELVTFQLRRQPLFSGELITLRSFLSWWALINTVHCRLSPVCVKDLQPCGADARGMQYKLLKCSCSKHKLHHWRTGGTVPGPQEEQVMASLVLNCRGQRTNEKAKGIMSLPMRNTTYHVVLSRIPF